MLKIKNLTESLERKYLTEDVEVIDQSTENNKVELNESVDNEVK